MRNSRITRVHVAVGFVLLAIALGVPTRPADFRANDQPPKVKVEKVEGKDHAFALYADDELFLSSADFGFHNSGNWYSTWAGTLNGTAPRITRSKDIFGPYVQYTVEYNDTASGDLHLVVYTRVYEEHENLVVFGQAFPHGLPDTSLNDNSLVVSAFPTFEIPIGGTPATESTNFFTYHDVFTFAYQNKWTTTGVAGGPAYGANGGSPLVLYKKNQLSMIVAPFNHFMVGAQTVGGPDGKSWACGIQGKVKEIPREFVYETVVVADWTVRKAMSSLGDVYLRKFDKPHPTAYGVHPTIDYLGYYTDNGAYYYYITEPSETYETTMLDVDKYARGKLNLPITYYQYDSWWYYKDNTTALMLWEPMPSVFPDGMGTLNEQIGLPVVLHNRWFSSSNDYVTKLNFTKSFVIESDKDFAVPINKDVFLYLMGKAKDWGMSVYEQDWLVTTYMKMDATQDNVYVGYEWLSSMASAAGTLNLTIQYCMPLPLHILQSVEFREVSHARASDDYNPSNGNWDLGYSSLFFWEGVGLVPFKDNFWTTSVNQTGCKTSFHNGCREDNPRLQTTVALLSAGPVAPSDKIGYINASLVNETCRSDGLLLKPDAPAMPLDATFYWSFDNPEQNFIHVWGTETFHGEDFGATKYILAINLTDSYNVIGQDIGFLSRSGYGVVYENVDGLWYYVSDFTPESPLNVTTDGSKPISTDAINFRQYMIAPQLPFGWYFFGDMKRIVPTSAGRIEKFVKISNTELGVQVRGAPYEEVEFSLQTPGEYGVFVQHTCEMNSHGSAFLHCTGQNCACA